AFVRSWAPWTKSPETLTSAASGARTRKVTVRSGATSQELYAGGALPRPPGAAGVAGACAGRRGVSSKGVVDRDSLDMPRIVSTGAAQGHAPASAPGPGKHYFLGSGSTVNCRVCARPST